MISVRITNQCVVVGCPSSQTIIHMGILTRDRVSEVLERAVVPGSTSLVTPICVVHYKQVYRLREKAKVLHMQ